MLRALNLAPSQADCEKKGQTKKAGIYITLTLIITFIWLFIKYLNFILKIGEKSISFEEFSAIYAEFYAMPEKTWGTYEDFIEGLKLYDKDQNGKLALNELCQVLSMMCKNENCFTNFFFFFCYKIYQLLNFFCFTLKPKSCQWLKLKKSWSPLEPPKMKMVTSHTLT